MHTRPDAAQPHSQVQTLVPLPLAQMMIQAARNGDAPWANIEQLVIRDPAPAPGAPALASALEVLTARHEGLRLVAQAGPDGQAVLALRARAAPSFATRDWSALAQADQDQALDSWLATDRAQGMDLGASPAWRVLLADLGAQGHALVLTVHHALMDAPAMAALVEDLFDLLAGRAPPAPAPGALTRALAQLHRLPPDADARARALLDGMDAPALLAPGGQAAPGRAQTLSRRLGPGPTQAFRARAAQVGTFAMVQAAWALVLARWTGADDVGFGLTLAGRNRLPDHARTLGCLIATLPQRVRLDDRPDLDTLAQRLRDQAGTLRGLHGARLDDLRGWAGLAPGQPLFDSVLVFARQTLATDLAQRGNGWEGRRVRLYEEGDVGLTVAVYDEGDLLVEVEFDAARLPPRRAARVLDHFARLLRAIAASPPGVATGDLAMLSPDEGARLARLGQPDRPLGPIDPDLAARIAAQAALGPALHALVADSDVITRAALLRHAGALAGALARATPGRVGIDLPRGPGFVVAVLACLMARRAFVPLDPAQPRDWRAGLLRDAGAVAVITESPAGWGLPTLAPFGPPGAPLPAQPPADPDGCAYLLYTSGSTGRPKGVMGRVGALAAHAQAAIDAYDLTPADRVLAVAAPAFDVALEEVLPALAAGATVVFAPPDALSSIPLLLDHAERHRVSVMNLPASLWHVMTDEMHRRRLRLPASVRLVVTGSERVAPGALALWRKLAPGVRWINAYGPTEATITALAHIVAPSDPATDPGTEVPVGRPLGHATVRLVAFDGSTAPEGAPGEIEIGGAAVTLGYLDRPLETARAFGTDAAGARVYRTGDRGQWRADGQMAFLGRRDRQVKLRGQRIDLAGVERALGALDGVRAVHVDLHAGTGTLVAWFTGPTAQEGADALARLRAEGARRLPGAALPVLVPLAALPLRANGKIDPARLPPPPARAPGPARAPLADGQMAQVAQVFAQVLGLDRIDPDADFRDLGGHSLAALKLAGALEGRFGRRTRTTDLYRHPTVRQFTHHLADPADGARYVVPIQPLGAGVPFFGVHVLGEKESLYRPLAAALGPDRPVYGLTMGPPPDPARVSIEGVAAAYFDDLQRHHPTGPLALGAVSMAAYFAFDLAQRLIQAGREVRLLAIFDAEGPGGRPPLTGRARLAAHGREFRRQGLGHLRAVLGARLDRVRFARDVALAGDLSVNGAVNGAALVMANVRAVDAYRAQPYVGPIAVYRAAASYWDSPQALDTALGWTAVARGGIERVDAPGDHLTILAPGNVDRIAAHLARTLPLD